MERILGKVILDQSIEGSGEFLNPKRSNNSNQLTLGMRGDTVLGNALVALPQLTTKQIDQFVGEHFTPTEEIAIR